MGKYSLGIASTEIASGVDKDHLYINDSKAKSVVKDMERQLEVMRVSLMNINELLNKTANKKVVKGTRADAYRSWAKKAKSQANAAQNLKTALLSKYQEDVQNYPIKLLDERIAELEKKLASILSE